MQTNENLPDPAALSRIMRVMGWLFWTLAACAVWQSFMGNTDGATQLLVLALLVRLLRIEVGVGTYVSAVSTAAKGLAETVAGMLRKPPKKEPTESYHPLDPFNPNISEEHYEEMMEMRRNAEAWVRHQKEKEAAGDE